MKEIVEEKMMAVKIWKLVKLIDKLLMLASRLASYKDLSRPFTVEKGASIRMPCTPEK